MLQNLNWIDYGILTVISFSVLMGVARGFVREAMSLLTWVVAIIVGYFYRDEVGTLWLSKISVDWVRSVLAFILLVLAVLIVGGVISYLIERLINVTKFGITDRVLGILFGFARGLVLVAVTIFIFSSFNIVQNNDLWKSSALIPTFDPLSVWLKEKVSTDWIKKIDDLEAEAEKNPLHDSLGPIHDALVPK